MTSRIRTEDAAILQFGGGINSRSSEDQIDPRECDSGQNFILDPGNAEYRPRAPFDKVGTLPNGAEVRGFVTHKKSDGTITMLVQGGANVYQWDGLTTFTLVGTVDSGAKLRGTQDAQWTLADKVIITDLELADVVMEWDGTTLADVSFQTGDAGAGPSPFGSALKAKYALVDNERLLIANLDEGGSAFPHLLVGSRSGDYTIITASSGQRPSSSIGTNEAWFLPMPQLKPINGLAKGFGVIAISQESGAMEQLLGDSGKDFNVKEMHMGSGAAGDESVVSIENDIMYGRPGVIESLVDTDKYGDVEISDPSFKIQPDIATYTSWCLKFNRRLHRLYAFPVGVSEVWVCQTDMLRSEVSPWSKWVTLHEMAFQPTATMTCWDPVTGLEYLFMGDSSGNVYRMEGSGVSGDGGTASITTKRRSVQFSAPVDAKFFRMHGYVRHRKNLENTLNLKFLWAGEHPHDVTKTIDLVAVPFTTAYGGSVYYAGTGYYGTQFQGRFIRSKFAVSGTSNDLQVEAEIEGVNTFAVGEIGIHFDAAS